MTLLVLVLTRPIVVLNCRRRTGAVQRKRVFGNCFRGVDYCCCCGKCSSEIRGAVRAYALVVCLSVCRCLSPASSLISALQKAHLNVHVRYPRCCCMCRALLLHLQITESRVRMQHLL